MRLQDEGRSLITSCLKIRRKGLLTCLSGVAGTIGNRAHALPSLVDDYWMWRKLGGTVGVLLERIQSLRNLLRPLHSLV